LFPNAEGTGYYRFTTDEKGWMAAISQLPRLDPADQYTLYHNVDAAMRGGTASATDYFLTVKALAPIARWDVLESDRRSVFNMIDSLREMRVTGVIAPSDLAKLQTFVRANFGPRLVPLGLAAKPSETPANALLREYLVQLLVEEGHDQALMAQLSKAAQAYLSSNGKDYGGIAPDLMQEAMRAGVMSQGPAFAAQVFAAMQKSDDEYFTQSAIYALAGSEDSATLNKLAGLILSPSLRIGDVRYVSRYMQSESAARPVMWAWFKANYDAMVKRVSTGGLGGAPDMLQFACDTATEDDLMAFFGPRTSKLEGTTRTLKEASDKINRCIAFKQAKGQEISAAIGALK
jgi:alanyl aminopeptidase